MRARYRTGEHDADAQWSGPWTATVTQRVRGDAPAAPTGLSVRERTDKKGTTVELSWTAPNHGALTGYRIWGGAGAPAVLVEDTGDTSTKYTDGTAEANTSYAYAVAALSLDGDSPRSETTRLVRRRTTGTTTPTPTPTPAPGEIATLTISSETVGVMSFDWSAPDPAPDRYLLNWNESHLSFPPLEDRNGNFYSTHIGMTFGDTIVEPGKTYKLRVRADYSTGDGAPWQGPWSETVVQRVRNHPPQAPANLQVVSATHDGVSLGWSASRHDALTGYRLLRGADAGALTTLAELGGDALTHTDAATESVTTYVYAVVALSPDGDSPRSGTVSATTPPRTPVTPVIAGAPAAPAGLTAALNGAGGVLLAWTDPSDSGVTGYRILRGVDARSLVVIAENTGSADAAYSDASPVVDAARVYAVQARNSAGLSQLSTTASATAISAPYGLSDDTNAFTATLTWSITESSAPSGYRVLRGASADSLQTLVDITEASQRTHTDTTIEAETAYYYAVQARNGSGLGPRTAAHQVVAPAAAAIVGFIGPQNAQQVTNVVLASNSDAADLQLLRRLSRFGDFKVTQALQFTTGRQPGGYTITGVEAHIDVSESPVGWKKPQVDIHAYDAAARGGVGARLHRFTASYDLPPGTVTATLTFDSAARLKPNTRYWLVLGTGEDQTSTTLLNKAPGSGRDRCGELDWVLAGNYQRFVFSSAGSPPSVTEISSPFAVSIIGSRVTTGVGVSERECESSPASAMTYLKLGDTSAAFDSTDAVYASGAQHSGDDLDRFEVNLQANVNYEFRATGARFLGGSAQSVEIKAVYNSSGAAQTIHHVEHTQRNTGVSSFTPGASRAYFTPAAAGTYYLEVGPVGGYAYHSVVMKHLIDFMLEDLNGLTPEDIPLGVRLLPRSEYPTYTVRLRKADDYTADTSTSAVVSPGGAVEGYFYTSHNGMTDVDWVRVALKSGVSYRFTVDAKGNANTIEEIEVLNSAGAAVAEFNDTRFSYGWRNLEYTPSADGDYYVALSSRVVNGDQHRGPAWMLRVWSTDQAAISEPADGDLPGLDNHPRTLLQTGAAPNNGDAASGRTPTTADTDLFAVWLEEGTRYRISAHETNTAGNCITLQLLGQQSWYIDFNQADALIQRAAGVPNPGGYTTLFYTPAPKYGGLYYIAVSHSAYYNVTGGDDLCTRPSGDAYNQEDRASSYSIVAHPASENRDADACFGDSKTVAWVVPGKPAAVDWNDGICQVGMELTQGKSYTLGFSGGGTTTYGIYSPSGATVLASGSAATYSLTATETGTYTVRVNDVSPAKTITITLTENTS